MLNQALFASKMPPKIQEVKAYFSQKGMSDLEAEHFFLFYEKKQWKSKNGNSFKNWKNIAWSWIKVVLNTQPWLFNKSIH
jgi:hypothetical protein